MLTHHHPILSVTYTGSDSDPDFNPGAYVPPEPKQKQSKKRGRKRKAEAEISDDEIGEVSTAKRQRTVPHSAFPVFIVKLLVY